MMRNCLKTAVAFLLIGSLPVLQAITPPSESVGQVVGTCAQQPRAVMHVWVSGYLVLGVGGFGPGPVMSWGTVWSTRASMYADSPNAAVALISYGSAHTPVSMRLAGRAVRLLGTVRCGLAPDMTVDALAPVGWGA